MDRLSNRLLLRYRACPYRQMGCALRLASDDWKGSATGVRINHRFLRGARARSSAQTVKRDVHGLR